MNSLVHMFGYILGFALRLCFEGVIVALVTKTVLSIMM